MRLATITEYGAATGDYHNLVTDLSAGKEFKPPFLIATLGLADLIEISFADDSPAEVPRSSGAHVFRRSFGVLWPEKEDLKFKKAVEFSSADELLRQNPLLPLFSTTYLKLSSIPSLCIPSSLGRIPLVKSILARMLSGNSSLWRSYRDVLRASLGHEEVGGLELQVALLIGLDSVDLVLLSRAARLEQVAALAWSLRLQKLGDYWDLREIPGAEGRIKQMTVASRKSPRDLWKQSALFGSSATVVGLPLYVQGDSITPEGLDEGKLIASNVCVSTRLIYTPGGFRKALDFPILNSTTLGKESGVEEDEFLLLFDRSDILRLPAEGMGGALHDLKLGDIHEYVRSLTSKGKVQEPVIRASRSIRARTEIAILTRIPNHLSQRTQEAPTDLNELFHERLRQVRQLHLSQDPPAWSRRWQDATKVAGMLYPITFGVLALIGAVLDYLEDDIEGFVELLPALEHLILLAERGDLQREELIPEVLKMSGMLQGLATSRGRRDHPFRFPRETLAFEGHAGNRAPRAAFVAFVESLAEALDPGTLVLVLESPGGAVSCRVGLDFNVVRVSPLVFFHPLHWVFAHEVAHGAFWHKSLKGSTQLPEFLTRKDNIHLAFGTLREDLRSTPSWLKDFASAVSAIVEEVPADLMLWDSLGAQSLDPVATDRLFWFVQGPGLILSLHHAWGSERLQREHIRPLILRVFALSQLARGGVQQVNGYALLCDLYVLLVDLRKEPMHTWRVRTQRTVEPVSGKGVSHSLHLLRCLREDLDLRPGDWRMAIEGLWAVVDTLLYGSNSSKKQRHESKELLKILQNWLDTTVEVRRGLQPQRQKHTDATWKCYREYLQSRIGNWPQSYPWLPFLIATGPSGVQFDGAPDVVIDPRGGILLGHADQRAEYWQATFNLLLRLDDLGRDGRFKKLSKYLGCV